LLTNGHLDLIERAQKLFDKLIVAAGANASKPASFFTIDERLDILRQVTSHWDNVEVWRLEGLTVEFAARMNAQFLIRGLRAVSDFEFELQLACMNHQLYPGIETIFLAAEPRHIFLSSRMIKDVWRNGGDVSEFVPPAVLEALSHKDKSDRS
jgi:pantetheine-phosphate adenylyltransferase